MITGYEGEEVLNSRLLLILRIVLFARDMRSLVMSESLVLRQHLRSVFVGTDDGRLAVKQVNLLEG
jgi:hypothetical protein